MSNSAGLSSLKNLLDQKRAKQRRRQEEEEEEEEEEENEFENGVEDYEQKKTDDNDEEQDEEEEFVAPKKKKSKTLSSSSHEEDDSELLRGEKEKIERSISKLKAQKQKTTAASEDVAANSTRKVVSDATEWVLSGKKKLTVEKFKGKILIDIREYYDAGGELKPTKKGIALSTAEW